MIRHLARVAATCFAATILTAQAATDIVVTTTNMVNATDGQCSLPEALEAAAGQSTFNECVVGSGGTPHRVILQANAVYSIDNQTRLINDSRFGKSLLQVFDGYGLSKYGIPYSFTPNIEIVGNGAVIERGPQAPQTRFFLIGSGTLTLRDLTLRNGDVINVADQPYGGAILSGGGTTNIERVTFDNNASKVGGAISIIQIGVVNVHASTFINHTWGAIRHDGFDPLNIANSTFYNNKPIVNGQPFGKGSAVVGGVWGPVVNLTHNTFMDSINFGKGPEGPLRLSARGNVFSWCYDHGMSVVSASNNIGPAPCPGVISSDLSSLQPADDNGGPTLTNAFVRPSPLENADTACTYLSAGTNPLFTNGAPVIKDQRGVVRVTSACDVGAYEEAFTRLSGLLLPAPQGLAYSMTLNGIGGTAPYSFSLVDGPAWLSVTESGGFYSLVGTPPSGHGTTVQIVLRTADANDIASYATYPLQIGNGLPDAPALTSYSFDDATSVMTVAFAPSPDDGGFPISGYIVRCALGPGYQSAASLTSPLTFTVPPGTYSSCAVVALNNAGSSAPSTETFSMAGDIPIVSSFTSATPRILPPNSNITYNITFNRSVIQLDNGDFNLALTGGITGAVITGVTGGPRNYQVHVYTGTGGYGQLALNFVDTDSVFDSIPNYTPVGGPGNGNGDFAGPVFAIAVAPDAPTITAMYAGDSQVTVAYDAPVNVNGLPVTGYQATCNPGATTASPEFPWYGEVVVPVTNGDTVTCTITATNAAGTSAPSAPMSIAIPSVAVTKLSQASGNPAAPGSTVLYDITFSRAVTGVDPSDFVLVTSGLSGAAITDVVGSDASYRVTVFTGSGTGTLRLDMVDDDTIRDATGPLNGIGVGAGATGLAYVVDYLPSQPEIVAALPGDSQAAVFFNPPLSDGGLPITDYQLDCGAPSGGPFRTAHGASSPIVIPLVNGWSYLCSLRAINSAGPGITSAPYAIPSLLLTSVAGITRASADPAYGSTVDYTVTFTNSVTGVDATDFAVATTGTIAGASIVGVTGTGATYTVTVNRGTGTGTLRLDLVADGSINDASAPLAVVGGVVNGETYTILNAPSVTSITAVGPTTTAAATVQYTVTFSGPVSGVDAADFSLTSGGTIASASVSTVTGGPQVYTVTVNTGTGSGTIRLDLVDNDSITDGTPLGGPGAGNGNAQGAVFTLDRGAPVVQSLAIVGGTPAGPVAGNTVITYEVTFSRPVLNVDATDFTATLTGSAAALPGGVTGSGAVYQIPYAVTGSGTVRINLVDDDSIADTLGNKLGGTGVGNGSFNTGPVVTVDGTAPFVSSIVRTGAASVIAGTSVGFTVTFSEAVTGVDAGDFTLVGTGTAAGTINGVSGSGTTYTVTVLTTAPGGTLRLDVVDNNTIVDAVLNPLGGPTAGDGNYLAGQAYTVVAPDRTYTGNRPGGGGSITATFTGGGVGCTFASAQFIAVSGDPGSPPRGSAPNGLIFDNGLFDFSTTGCTAGSTITVAVTYPTPVRPGSRYYKYGVTAASPVTPVWYVIPSTVAGNTVTFSITDGGLGDSDLAANGTIVDPGGLGLLLPAVGDTIPTLSEWMLILMGLMMFGFAMRRLRR